MAKQFRFKNYDLELDIEGIMFHVDCRASTGDKMKKYAEGGPALITELQANRKTKDDALKYLLDAINDILGEGAADKIFASHEPNVTDCSDLLIFLCQEIGAKYNIQREKFTPKK